MEQTQQSKSDRTTEANRAGNSLARLEIVPSGAATGAEVRGIDLSQPIPDDIRACLLGGETP